MTKKSIILFALWVLQIQANAATVNASTAQTVALNFYKSTVSSLNPHTDLSAILVYTQNESDGTADSYVFDVNPVHGFVIISAADNVQPILAYSTETNFNSNFPEIGIKTWLSNTARSVRGAILSNVQPAAHNANLWNAYKQGLNPAQQKGTGVSPLLTTTWNQSPYYNAMCPYDNANQAQCITGCVATAMAQIMKYWAYPAKGTGSYSYADEESNGYSENIGTVSANFGATTYQWSSMPANVTTNNTPVATLMYQCGVALGMDYSAYGSMAYLYYYQHPCVYNAFKNYFGYDSLSLRYVSMSDDSAGWIGMLENELTAGRPILYSGSGPGGGHAWVCDGFDANELFHMNWGWSGQDDGYFAVTNLNPGGSDDLSEGQNIIIGIQPPAAPVANFGVNSVVSCNGICQFTDSSYGGPTSWLWNFGDGSTSTQQNPLHQYIKNGTYSVSLVITNVYGTNTKKLSDYITVSRPAAPSVDNVSNCTASTFSLKANTSNPVTWFDSTGTQVSTANPFVTPALKETTTYWVEEWNIDTVNKTNYSVGEAPNTSGFYEYYYNNNNYFQLKFNVSLPITLQSVLIYSGVTGSRTIVCTNGSKTTLATKTVSVQPGSNRVNLNFSLPAGGPYYLGFTNDSLMEFGQDAASYPYTDASGIVQITGNNLKSNSYAYFYDWVVSEPGYCLSQLGPATATVGASAASITANGPTSFCEGGSVTLTATFGASYKWSSGQTTQTITATSAGTYAVTVVSTGSCSAVSGPEVVTVNAKPEAAITASGPTTFCSGASVTLTASSGKTYKWSSGQTTQAIAATTSGNYSVTVSNSSFCSAVSSPEAITVNAKPLATIAAGGPTAFCTGGSVILTASSNSTYKWSSGQTTQAITVVKSGNYTVSVVGSNSCSAISAGEVITVSAQPEATITATGATTFCANDSVVLTASPASTYAWSSGETTQAVTISTAGTYTVTVINSGTCSAISAPEVVAVNTMPEAAITPSGSICGDSTETLTAVQSDGVNYRWSTGDTTFAISVKAAGNYAVTVSNADCSAEAASIVSACTDTTQGITGINSLSINGYALQATAYPNPYTNQFHLKVESSSEADNIHIRIFNANGQLIEERISPADTTDVMLGSNNAAGVYFVQINQDNTNRELKVVKIE